MEQTPELTDAKRAARIETVQAFILSFATVATAWCGYQAALWNGVEATAFGEAAARRVDASRAATRMGHQALGDLLLFNRWLDADLTGNLPLAGVYERRFRPELRAAFDAWRHLDPVHDPRARAGPLVLPEYRPAIAREARRLEAEADRIFDDGERANDTSNDYVQATVFFALVMFCMGVAPRYEVHRVRIAMTAFGFLVLVFALARVFALPIT